MAKERTMISFHTGAGVFQLRVAAVVIRDGYVLLHRAESDAFWALPGGRAEVGETSTEALEREMLEETGTRVSIERMLWLVENFFRLPEPVHEVGLYFLVTMPPEEHASLVQQFFGYEDNGTRLIFQWHRIADLGAIDVLPNFLREGLKSLPTVILHIIHKDERGL